jgi:hypothetical protein
MNDLHDLVEDVSDQDLARVKDRVVRRGAQIRRHRFAIRSTVVALAVCAVAIPLSLAGQQKPSLDGATSATFEASSAGPFREVVWKSYFNPTLDVTTVHFPGNIGCNPGNRGAFRVVVQQVAYIRVKGAGSPIALALVHCNANTPPSSLYALTFPQGATQPHVLQTLLAPPISGNATSWSGSDLSAAKGVIVLNVRGVTPTDTWGLCCPNVAGIMRWTLHGTHFVQQTVSLHSLPKLPGYN